MSEEYKIKKSLSSSSPFVLVYNPQKAAALVEYLIRTGVAVGASIHPTSVNTIYVPGNMTPEREKEVQTLIDEWRQS